jgi:uncharacterized protein YkwD
MFFSRYKIIFLAIFSAFAFFIFYFYEEISLYLGGMPPLSYQPLGEIVRHVAETPKPEKKEIYAPPPLRKTATSPKPTETPAVVGGGPEKTPELAETPSLVLSRQGILKWSNYYRTQNGLKNLFSSTVLDKAAENKLADMFKNQYFAHVAPDGKDAAFWVESVGYQYLAIGENLALGIFDGDNDLVDAWMDSPGHRANILGVQFTEIGIAAKKGSFEGKQVWIAVQVFGKNYSECPEPSAALKEKIEIYEDSLSIRESEIAELKDRIENGGFSRREYLVLVEEYNRLVSGYNLLIEEIKDMIEDYNNQVRSFNFCVQSS